ncbi:retrovirus-related pol polyprotein from transposon TNT 1-94, partial [Tanacetum coccineum]
EVILNGESPLPTRTVDGVETAVPPTTADQKLTRKNELKARVFDGIYRERFRGNKESKKVQKTLLKQQYENFNGKSSEGLDQIYDRLQKLISQLEIHGETISQEDLNINTNEAVKTAHGASATNSKANASTLPNVDSLSDAVIYSFFARQSNSLQLDNVNLKQIDPDDLEEMDLKWQMTMLIMRARRFLKKTGKNLGVNRTDTNGFDKTKVECYNCHRRGHFARECRAPKQQDNRNREITRSVPIEETTSNALVSQCDGFGYDWSDQAKEGPTNFALMAYTSAGSLSSSNSDTEVSTCSKACLKSYETLKEHYDNLTKDFNKSQLKVEAYKAGLESVEVRLDVYKKNEVVFEELFKILKLYILLRDNALTELRKKFKKAKKERDYLKLTLEKFENSSKNLSKLLDIQVSDKFKTGVGYDSQVFDSQENDKYKTSEGYHVVPPPYTGNFMPPKPDLVLADEDEYVFSESVTSVPDIATSKSKTSESKPKSVSEPLIEDWISASEDENETEPKSKQRKSSFAKVEFVKSNEHVKSPKKSVKSNKQAKHPRKTVKVLEGESPKFSKNDSPSSKKNLVPRAVLMKSGHKTFNTAGQNSSRAALSVNTARPINTVYPRPTVNYARPTSNVFNRAHSHVSRPFNKFTTNKNSNFNERVNTIRENVTTVGPKAVVSDNKGNQANVVKASACWVWRPKQKVLDHVSRHNGASMNFKRFDYVDAQGISKTEKGVIDSRFSRHMIGNMSYLSDYEEIDGGYVAFGGDPKGGKITGKVAEKKNRTLIKAARTMLVDLKLPTTFWAKAVNTACYVQIRVLVIKPHNKTPYELFHGRTPSLSFMRPFGYPVTILNTLDHLGKFDGKADEGFFVRYPVNSKAFRVFNSRTRIVEENLHITFLENKPNVAGSGPEWLFDIDTLTKSINYKLVVAGNQSNGSAGTKACDNACKARVETVPGKDYILLPFLTQDLLFSSSTKDSPDVGFKPSEEEEKNDVGAPENEDGELLNTEEPRVNQENDESVNSTNNINNLSSTVNTASIEDNVVDENIAYGCADDPNMPNLEEIDYSNDDEGVGAEANKNNLDTFMPVSLIPTTRIHKDHPQVWTLVDLPYGKRAIGTKWIYRNKKDERGIVVRNKARLVAQDGCESAFLYGKIEKEVYVCQPLGFEDPEFPDRVYKVEKALYGLLQAPRAWYKTLSTYLLYNRFQRSQIDKTLFIKRVKSDILLVQVSSMGELTFFLGLQVTQKDDGIFISQDKYVDEILKKFGFSTVKTASTPMETSKSLLKDENAKDVDVHLYRLMIGSLMYLTSSRPDIMFVVLWIQNQLLDYGYNFMNTKIFIDNESTICIVKNPVFHSKTKHIEIRHHFIRDSNEKKLIQMIKIHTDQNVADLLTKAFDVSRF